MRTLGRGELEKVAPHVEYEIEAMLCAHKQYGATHDRLILEAFLIHVRCLHEFFTQPRKQDTDVRAQNYFEFESDWTGACPPMPDVFNRDEMVERLNRRVTHLSTDRARWFERERTENWAWPTQDLETAILDYSRAFLLNMPSDRKEWFKSLPALLGTPGT